MSIAFALSDIIKPLNNVIIRDVSSPLHGWHFAEELQPKYFRSRQMSEAATPLAADIRRAILLFSQMVDTPSWETYRDSSLRIFAILHRWASQVDLCNFCIAATGDLYFVSKSDDTLLDGALSYVEWLQGYRMDMANGWQILAIWNLILRLSYVSMPVHAAHSASLARGHSEPRFAAEAARHFAGLVLRRSFRTSHGYAHAVKAKLGQLYSHLGVIAPKAAKPFCLVCDNQDAYYRTFLLQYLDSWQEVRCQFATFMDAHDELTHWLAIAQSVSAPPASPPLSRTSTSSSSSSKGFSILSRFRRSRSNTQTGLRVVIEELGLASRSALPSTLIVGRKHHDRARKRWMDEQQQFGKQ